MKPSRFFWLEQIPPVLQLRAGQAEPSGLELGKGGGVRGPPGGGRGSSDSGDTRSWTVASAVCC